MTGLDGETAIVTGGASGIGRATATKLAAAGATVVVADVDVAGGEETVDAIAADGGRARFVRTDVTEATDVSALVDVAVEEFGGLDVLFNNAGVDGEVRPIESYDEDVFDEVLDVNLKGVWLGTKYGVRAMLGDGGGAIVNTASITGVVGMPGFSAYAAAKGGIILLTKTVALEYADAGIRVNAVAPGPVRTPLVERAIEGPASESRFEAMEPMPGIAEPEEVADAVRFLASDRASRVSGTTLPVDGGYLAGRTG